MSVFSELYSSIANTLQYFLPEKQGELSSWEKKWVEKISRGAGYRLATSDCDAALVSRLATLSDAAGLKSAPKLVIYRDDVSQAQSLWNRTIVLSTGALKALSPDELDALLAHEIGHNLHKKTSNLVDPILVISALILSVFSTKAVNTCIFEKEKKVSNLNTLAIAAIFTGFYTIIGNVVKIPQRAFMRALEY